MRMAQIGSTSESDAGMAQRIAGCESSNHTACYGTLWQCIVCKKTVCYQEGTDDRPDFCDDCWASKVQDSSVASD
jgi:hypothetical protein